MQYTKQNIRKNARTDFFSIMFWFMTIGAQTEWKNFLTMNNHT